MSQRERAELGAPGTCEGLGSAIRYRTGILRRHTGQRAPGCTRMVYITQGAAKVARLDVRASKQAIVIPRA